MKVSSTAAIVPGFPNVGACPADQVVCTNGRCKQVVGARVRADGGNASRLHGTTVGVEVSMANPWGIGLGEMGVDDLHVLAGVGANGIVVVVPHGADGVQSCEVLIKFYKCFGLN